MNCERKEDKKKKIKIVQLAFGDGVFLQRHPGQRLLRVPMSCASSHDDRDLVDRKQTLQKEVIEE